MSLQATVIREILLSAASHSTAYDTLCKLCGITNEEISNSENMVEWEKAALIWVPLRQMSNDEQIGLHLGMEMNISMLGMVGFLMQSCKDLEQAVQTFCRYSPMVAPMVEFIYTTKEVATVEMRQNRMWQAKYPEPARQALEFTVAALLKFLRGLSGKNIWPQRIESEFSQRAVAEYHRLFGCHVVFNASGTRIVFNNKDMKLPVVSSDKSLFDLFNSILAQKRTALEAEDWSEKLRQLLFMQYKGQVPTIEEAAVALGVSVRSLQRKLLEEKTTYRAITNNVKKELAFQLMKNPAIRISEVAEVMGYADTTAFRRAFKAWTQETPKLMRQKIKESKPYG